MLNRRVFLQRFGIGVGAALALASLPASAVQALTVADAGKRCAIEYLRAQYRAYVKGMSVSRQPRRMHVSPGLFAAFEGELPVMYRFVPGEARAHVHPRTLCFMGMALSPDDRMTGWDVRFVDPPVEWAMNTTGMVHA